MKKHLFYISICLIALSCNQKQEHTDLFTELAKESGITFNNALEYTEELNPYTYRNFYNGGGVALGDVNNDGLLDIFFSGNLVENKLYLNKGNWRFEDITESAGLKIPNVWSTGATFVDINSDGWLDLYVCKSGPPSDKNRSNELFINQGDGTFIEQASAYNLDIEGLSTHAAFFDYDKDGDLDVYILNNSIRSVGVGQDIVEGRRKIPSKDGSGNKFMRNDNGAFTDITLEAGVYNSDIGYGLGITLSDFNEDGWTDIFISNDFFERDYLYINNQKGGFTENADKYFSSLSMGSMGADGADLDNDGLPEIMVTEMLPANRERKRTKAIYESWDKYSLSVSKGYSHQFPRNVLQRNIGNGNFSEIGRLSGVSASEWSWGTLIFDANNDGLKDIFISNGIYKDLLDRDYLNYMANDAQVRNLIQTEENAITKLVDIMPSVPVVNSLFINEGELQFNNKSDQIGLSTPSFSNGAAYGDLDNDGDLDLVVNNVNMPAFVYRNESDTSNNKSIRIKLEGEEGNKNGIGAKIKAWSKNELFYTENFPSKGFQSSMDQIVHLGLGNRDHIDSIRIEWNSNKTSKLYDISTNQLIHIKENDGAQLNNSKSSYNMSYLSKVDFNSDNKVRHEENDFVDFDRERLLPFMYSNEGPGVAIGDIDNDGQSEIFLGGAKSSTAQMIGTTNNELAKGDLEAFEKDQIAEDTDAVFFDANGDGFEDLYVASGGRAFSNSSPALLDRLYMNDGEGNFSKETSRLPFTTFFSSSSVSQGDYDNDGDIDLFVSERFNPFYYGEGGRGYLLQNDGKGFFKDVTSSLAPELATKAMLTDSEWLDIDQDGDLDLITVGDWEAVKIYENVNGAFDPTEIKNSKGWWHSIHKTDIDNDGDIDLILGNHGLNSFFKARTRMYRADFDDNGTYEHIFCEYENGKYYPVSDRDELIMQIPKLKKDILFYKDYADKAIDDLFDKETLSKASIFDVDVMTSAVLVNEGGKFTMQPLPTEAQYAPVYAINSADINGDGYQDIVLGGNQYLVKPQFGRYDASSGLILFGSKDGFKENNSQFLTVKGQIRAIEKMELSGKKLFLFFVNNGPVEIYEW